MKRMTPERLDFIESQCYLTKGEQELLDALNTDRTLLNEAEELMCRMVILMTRATAGQTMNEFAGDMNAWMEKLNE